MYKINRHIYKKRQSFYFVQGCSFGLSDLLLLRTTEDKEHSHLWLWVPFHSLFLILYLQILFVMWVFWLAISASMLCQLSSLVAYSYKLVKKQSLRSMWLVQAGLFKRISLFILGIISLLDFMISMALLVVLWTSQWQLCGIVLSWEEILMFLRYIVFE